MAKAVAQADDGNGGVGQAGEVAGQFTATDAGTVPVAGEVADVVQAVLDLPMTTVEGKHFGWPGLADALRVQPGAAAKSTQKSPLTCR